jgi:hypothetical protein
VPISERHQVVLFLLRMKALVSEGRLYFWSREENSATLAELGLLYKHQIETLEALTAEHYCETLPPQHPNAEAWVFGVRVLGKLLYVKLGIQLTEAQGDYVSCSSFHIAGFPMTHPHK